MDCGENVGTELKRAIHINCKILKTTFKHKLVAFLDKKLQHVQRMDTNRIPKQALQYRPKGRRNIGRPRKRWRDQLHLEDQGTGNMPNPS
jgi:hypothetical protein